ncbi:MAG: carph-isopro domain-containing protein [Alphaproteobacteria bacterium]
MSDDLNDLDFESVPKVISAFGGLRPMANALGVAASTVQGWKERNHIPKNHHDSIRDAYIERAYQNNTVNPAKYSPSPTLAYAQASSLFIWLALAGLAAIALGNLWLSWYASRAGTVEEFKNVISSMPSNQAELADIREKLEEQTDLIDRLFLSQAGRIDLLEVRIEESLQAATAENDSLTLLDLEPLERLLEQIQLDLALLSEASNENYEQLSQSLLTEAKVGRDNSQLVDRINDLEVELRDAQIALLEKTDQVAAVSEFSTDEVSDAVKVITRIRLAIANKVINQSDLEEFAYVAQADSELMAVLETLQEFARSDRFQRPIPAAIFIADGIDNLIEVDRTAIRSSGFGFGRIPPATNLESNQGRLFAAKRDLIDHEYSSAASWLKLLDGVVADQATDLILDLNALALLQTAGSELDRWLSDNLWVKDG